MKFFISSPLMSGEGGIFMSSIKPEKVKEGNEIHWIYKKLPLKTSVEKLLIMGVKEEEIPSPGELTEVDLKR